MLTYSTDELVNRYLDDDNMQYYSIHPPSFLRAYEEFWAARAHPVDRPSPAFTCLLLQMCSNVSRRSNSPLKERLDGVLAQKDACASEVFFNAAERLNNAMSPGVGGTEKVLRLLLAAAWWKGDGEIVNGWHAFSAAVREAQECGMMQSAWLRSRLTQ